jgi:hypothetical protein
MLVFGFPENNVNNGCKSGMAQWVYQWAMGWMARIQFLAEARVVYSSVQASSGAHRAYSMGIMDSFPGGIVVGA